MFITHDIDEAVFLADKIYIMSTHPGMIMEEKNIYLPHKRTLDIKDSQEFLKIRREINEELYATAEG